MSINKSYVFVGILLIGFFLRLFAFCGAVGSDDIRYAELAHRISNGTFSVAADSDISGMRIGLLMPVALAFKFLGPSEGTLVLYPFLLSMLSIVLAFFGGRMLFNERTGLIAAALQAILPFDVRSASLLLSDIPAAFLGNLGILLIYRSAKHTFPRKKILSAILAGLSLGLAWLTRESAVYLFPLVGAYLLLLAWRQKSNAAIVAGVCLTMLSVFVVESLVYYKHTGDPMHRLHVVAETAQNAWKYDTTVFQNNRPESLKARILKRGPSTIFLNLNFGYITAVAVLAVAYGAWRKSSCFLLPALWFLSLALMFNMGSTSLKSYSPLMLHHRYLYSLLFPAVLLCAGLIGMLIPSRELFGEEIARERLFWGSLLTVGMVAVCGQRIHGYIHEGVASPIERTVSRKVGPREALYTDTRTSLMMEFFWKYPQEMQIHDIKGMKSDEFPSGVFVLINRRFLDLGNRMYGYKLPEFYSQVPENWILKWKQDRADLYWIP